MIHIKDGVYYDILKSGNIRFIDKNISSELVFHKDINTISQIIAYAISRSYDINYLIWCKQIVYCNTWTKKSFNIVLELLKNDIIDKYNNYTINKNIKLLGAK